eukprot:276527-Chlamydomonas_euryale.AAC.1
MVGQRETVKGFAPEMLACRRSVEEGDLQARSHAACPSCAPGTACQQSRTTVVWGRGGAERGRGRKGEGEEVQCVYQTARHTMRSSNAMWYRSTTTVRYRSCMRCTIA